MPVPVWYGQDRIHKEMGTLRYFAMLTLLFRFLGPSTKAAGQTKIRSEARPVPRPIPVWLRDVVGLGGAHEEESQIRRK
jgi:hypothetical protein